MSVGVLINEKPEKPVRIQIRNKTRINTIVKDKAVEFVPLTILKNPF